MLDVGEGKYGERVDEDGECDGLNLGYEKGNKVRFKRLPTIVNRIGVKIGTFESALDWSKSIE